MIYIVDTKDTNDLQIIFYTGFSLLMALLTWLIFFIKFKKPVRIIYLIILIFYLITPNILPSVKLRFIIDDCYDSGGCWDDIRSRCEMEDRGKCAKDKEQCEKYMDGVWDSERQYCVIGIFKK